MTKAKDARPAYPNEAAHRAFSKTQDALGRASAYLDNPKGSNVRKELAFPDEKVEQAKQALADAKPLIPARWDVQIPEAVPAAIEAAVAALSAVITHAMCQEIRLLR